MTLDDDRVKAVGEATGPRRLAGVASGGPGNSTDIATVMANAFVTAVVSALIVGLILARYAIGEPALGDQRPAAGDGAPVRTGRSP